MKNFRRNLGWLTVGFTYFLMVWGNLVSSTGSGLACPDWPLCHGTVMPAASFPVVLEWGHRILAFIATTLIGATLYQVFTTPSDPGSSLKRSGKFLLWMLAAQILLGATTVLLELSPLVSTIHLMIATLVFSGLIAVACVMTWPEPMISNSPPKIQRLAIAGLGGLLVQLCLGALVRHHHGGLACPNFPHCLNGFFPIPLTFESGLAFIHRWWGVLMLGLFVHLAITAAKTFPPLAQSTRRAFSLAVAQVFLGIGTVMSGLNTESRALHAAVGYALWGILFYIAVRAGAVRWIYTETSEPFPQIASETA